MAIKAKKLENSPILYYTPKSMKSQGQADSWLGSIKNRLLKIKPKNTAASPIPVAPPVVIEAPTINIQENVPLAPFTTFKIGGPARFFCEVKSEEMLLEAVNFAKKSNLKIFILGGGSNVLVSDAGFNGLVIKLAPRAQLWDFPELSSGRVYLWAGDSLASMVKFAAENSLSGLEWAAGIPGTIGGAVRGNAGSPQGTMSDILTKARILDLEKKENKEAFREILQKECAFSYRSSIFKNKPGWIITSVEIKLKKGAKNEIRSEMKEIMLKRSQGKHPNPKFPNPGSFFKNPIVNDNELIKKFEKETGVETKRNKNLYQGEDIKLPAGWLIEEAGLKGKKIGGAMVSQQHANFVINKGNATASDVVMLASFVKMKVRNQFGVQLREEVQYVGF